MSLRGCCAGHNRPAATSPGGVERRGAPTKVCRGATLACSGGVCGDWPTQARRRANSGDIVTTFANYFTIELTVFNAGYPDRPVSAAIGAIDAPRLATRAFQRPDRLCPPIWRRKRRGRTSPWLEKVRCRQRSWGTIIDWRTSAIRNCSLHYQSWFRRATC